jgi:threonine/homoserine/homoserine lactone efflux protein
MRSVTIGMEMARARARDLAAQAATERRPRRPRGERGHRGWVRSALGAALVGAGTRLLHEGVEVR